MTAEPENRGIGESGNLGSVPPPVETVYPARFFRGRHRLAWRAPIVCAAIRDVLHPGSVVDVGCATGDLVGEFRRMEIDAWGIEGSAGCLMYLDTHAQSHVTIHDLRLPLSSVDLSALSSDLCISLEVAEHIDPEYATQYVTTLCGLSDRILLSAAPPGQGGHGHVNCRPPAYWAEQFWQRGYYKVIQIEALLQAAWKPWAHKKGIKAYYDNLMYFERLS